MKKRDAIVENVRKIRDRHARKFKYDLEAIFRDLKKKENNDSGKIVSFQPRISLKKTGT